MRKAALMLLIGLTVPAYGEELRLEEVWRCSPGIYYAESRTVVVAKVFEGRELGEIEVAGTVQPTEFKVVGFNRRWNFGLKPDGHFKYAFIIDPSGMGSYYEFGTKKEAAPSQNFGCAN